jgi:hypothetical protein
VDDLEQFVMAVKYVTAFDEGIVSEGELALIYPVLPHLMPQLIGWDSESE